MRQFPCFHTLLLLCGTLPGLAQDTLPVILRGQVTDAQTGDPLPSASVSVPSYRIHTTTNGAGMFLIVRMWGSSAWKYASPTKALPLPCSAITVTSPGSTSQILCWKY